MQGRRRGSNIHDSVYLHLYGTNIQIIRKYILLMFCQINVYDVIILEGILVFNDRHVHRYA